jgi:hypothetical protein
MSLSRKLFALLLLIACFCVTGLPQTPAPIGIQPQPPEGKGVVVIKTARLIDGTGAAAISNAIVIVTDNKITAELDPVATARGTDVMKRLPP